VGSRWAILEFNQIGASVAFVLFMIATPDINHGSNDDQCFKLLALEHTLQRQVEQIVAPLLWPSVGVKPNTWKSRELESSRTLECLELDSKGQNTSHWGVFGVIGKVLKRNYRKWPRIGHLDICSPSYGQKKGRESNWQFDSQPLKVGNRPFPDIRFGSAIRR
jgi:hypothetical protein